MIDIIIPNYNGATHLPTCLDSLRGQTRRDFCVVAPAEEEGWARAFVFAGRLCSVRNLPPGGGAALELEAGWAAVRRARAAEEGAPLAPEAADELLTVAPFLRRPPPELRILG